MPIQRFLLTWVIALASIPLAGEAAEGLDAPVPPEAQVVIDRVRGAALSRDYETLRKNMNKAIRLYFGSADGNFDEVLEAWRKEPEYFLAPMGQVLRACRLQLRLEVPTVECHLPEEGTFRARFQLSEGAWKLMSFVNGD
jgi:hypothetical protein